MEYHLDESRWLVTVCVCDKCAPACVCVCILVRAVQFAGPTKVTVCLSAPWEKEQADLCVCVCVVACVSVYPRQLAGAQHAIDVAPSPGDRSTD